MSLLKKLVALLVSAWIEIDTAKRTEIGGTVALLVSAWIEIIWIYGKPRHPASRTPRECVD
mgnify:CR=1 FL=1